MPHNVLQLIASRKNLLRIGEGHTASVGQLEPASDATEKLPAEALLQEFQLSADRLRRKVQTLGRSRHAAGLGNDPEVVEMLVIERGHCSKTPNIHSRSFDFIRISHHATLT